MTKINNKQEDENIYMIQPPVAPIKLVSVSVREFLTAIFGPDLRNAWVCATRSADAPDWNGSSAGGAHLDGPGWNDHNCYYSVAVLKPGATSRKDVNWSHTRVIVVDDVVEKADPDKVRACLGEPSFIVQTSPGSQQWGYILDTPITDLNVQAQLMRAITLAFFKGIEPGHRDLTRYVRLPVGVNNKAGRVSANGGTAPAVSCVSWEPSRRFALMDLVDGLDGVDSALDPTKSAWEDAESTRVLAANSSVAGMGGAYRDALMSEVDYWIGEGDYILDAFRELDWIVGEDNNGYYKVRCPWDMNGTTPHSNTDDRTGWSPQRFLGLGLPRKEKGWSCFHTDGSLDPHGRKDHEVMDELRAALDAEDALKNTSGTYERIRTGGVQTQARNVFGAAPLSAGMVAIQTALATAVAAATATPAPPVEFVPLLRSAPATLPAQRRRIGSAFARGEVTQIVGAPSAGKSAIVSVALSAAMCAGRPDLFGEKDPFDRLGDIYLISNEDGVDDVRKRTAAWFQKHNIQRSAFKHELRINKQQNVVVARQRGKDGPVELTEVMDQLGADIDAKSGTPDDVCMVILDTQATVFEGIGENDNNGAARVLAILAKWAKEHNVSLVLLHHMAKASGKDGGEGDMMSGRGASAVAAAARNLVTLTGLTDAEAKLLKPIDGHRNDWVKFTGAKGSHAGIADRRWFQKHIMAVIVEDERRPGQLASDPVPVYVFHDKGPDLGGTADALFRVTATVCDMLKASAPLRVSVTGDTTGLLSPTDFLADHLDMRPAEAAEALKAAVDRGYIEKVDGPRNADGNHPKVYRPTKDGGSFVEKRRAKGGPDTADIAGSSPL